jgi:hypothetical protein
MPPAADCGCFCYTPDISRSMAATPRLIAETLQVDFARTPSFGIQYGAGDEIRRLMNSRSRDIPEGMLRDFAFASCTR